MADNEAKAEKTVDLSPLAKYGVDVGAPTKALPPELAKYAMPEPEPEAKTVDRPFVSTLKSTGAHMLNSFAGQPVEDIGEAVGSDTIQKAGKGIRNYAERVQKDNPGTINSLSDIAEHPVDAVKTAAGNVVPQLPVSLASGWAGAKAGAMLPLPPHGRAAAGIAGGLAGLFAPSYLQEYTEMRGKQHENGQEDIPKALGYAVPAAASDVVMDKVLLGGSKLLPKPLRNAAADTLEKGASRLAHVGKQGAKGFGAEAAQEYGQTYLEQAGGNEDTGTEQAAEERNVSAALGGIGGSMIKGGVSAFDARKETPVVDPAVQPPVNELPVEPENTELPEEPEIQEEIDTGTTRSVPVSGSIDGAEVIPTRPEQSFGQPIEAIPQQATGTVVQPVEEVTKSLKEANAGLKPGLFQRATGAAIDAGITAPQVEAVNPPVIAEGVDPETGEIIGQREEDVPEDPLVVAEEKKNALAKELKEYDRILSGKQQPGQRPRWVKQREAKELEYLEATEEYEALRKELNGTNENNDATQNLTTNAAAQPDAPRKDTLAPDLNAVGKEEKANVDEPVAGSDEAGVNNDAQTANSQDDVLRANGLSSTEEKPNDDGEISSESAERGAEGQLSTARKVLLDAQDRAGYWGLKKSQNNSSYAEALKAQDEWKNALDAYEEAFKNAPLWEKSLEDAGREYLAKRVDELQNEYLSAKKSKEKPFGYKSSKVYTDELFRQIQEARNADTAYAKQAGSMVDHYAAVRQALAEGKPVPAEVLAEYPDLLPANSEQQSAEQPVAKESAEPAAYAGSITGDKDLDVFLNGLNRKADENGLDVDSLRKFKFDALKESYPEQVAKAEELAKTAKFKVTRRGNHFLSYLEIPELPGADFGDPAAGSKWKKDEVIWTTALHLIKNPDIASEIKPAVPAAKGILKGAPKAKVKKEKTPTRTVTEGGKKRKVDDIQKQIVRAEEKERTQKVAGEVVGQMKEEAAYNERAKNRQAFVEKHALKGAPFARSLINNDYEKAVDDLYSGRIPKDVAAEIFEDAKTTGLLNDVVIKKVLAELDDKTADTPEQWAQTAEEHHAYKLASSPYRESYEKSPEAAEAFKEYNLSGWKGALEERAQQGRIPENVLDSYVAKFGAKALYSVFRGVKEKGIEGYLPPEMRAEQEAEAKASAAKQKEIGKAGKGILKNLQKADVESRKKVRENAKAAKERRETPASQPDTATPETSGKERGEDSGVEAVDESQKNMGAVIRHVFDSIVGGKHAVRAYLDPYVKYLTSEEFDKKVAEANKKLKLKTPVYAPSIILDGIMNGAYTGGVGSVKAMSSGKDYPDIERGKVRNIRIRVATPEQIAQAETQPAPIEEPVAKQPEKPLDLEPTKEEKQAIAKSYAQQADDKKNHIVLNEGNGKVMNDLYRQWNGIKTKEDSDNFKRDLVNTRFGTYGTLPFHEVLAKFEPKFPNDIVEKAFTEETKKILKNPDLYAGKSPIEETTPRTPLDSSAPSGVTIDEDENEPTPNIPPVLQTDATGQSITTKTEQAGENGKKPTVQDAAKADTGKEQGADKAKAKAKASESGTENEYPPQSKKEAREWLVAKIDAAILEAPDKAAFADVDEARIQELIEEKKVLAGEFNRMQNHGNPKEVIALSQKIEGIGREQRKIIGEALDKVNGRVTFKIPGGTQFKVRNDKPSLQEFKKKVLASPGFKDTKATKPQSRYHNTPAAQVVANFLKDDELENAYYAAKANGVPIGFGNTNKKGAHLIYVSIEPVALYKDRPMFVGHRYTASGDSVWHVIDGPTAATVNESGTEKTKTSAIASAKSRLAALEKKGFNPDKATGKTQEQLLEEFKKDYGIEDEAEETPPEPPKGGKKPDVKESLQDIYGDPATFTSELEAAEHLVKAFGPGINTLIRDGILNITRGQDKWPPQARRSSQGRQSRIEGVYVNDKAFIDIDATVKDRLQAVALHEIGEHFNLRKMLGTADYEALQNQITNRAKIKGSEAERVWNQVKAIYTNEALNRKALVRGSKEQDAWLKTKMNHPELVYKSPEFLDAVAQELGQKFLKEGDESFIAEVIAKLGEVNPNAPWYRRLIARIKAFLMERGLARGFVMNTLTDKDIHALLVASLQSAARSQERGVARFYGAEGAMQSAMLDTQTAYISDEQWAREVSDASYTTDGTTRAAITKMTPDDFLRAASDSEGDSLRRAKEYGTFDAAMFTSDWLPTLDVLPGGKIESHEGRARAEMARLEGVEEIPVILRFPKSDRLKKIEDVPKFLTAQDSDKKILLYGSTLVYYGVDNPYKQEDTNSVTSPQWSGGDTITVDGKERSTTNSNGKPIAATEEGLRNFWKWFGESKVVDDAGRPLLVYHGTTSTFSQFDTEKSGANKFVEANDNGLGSWFATRPGSKGFQGTYTDAAGFAGVAQKGEEITAPEGANLVPAYIAMENPKVYAYNDYPQAVKRAKSGKNLRAQLEADGFDGVIRNGFDDKPMHSVAFSPNQIKSAIGNTGDFSPDSNDIRYSIVDDILSPSQKEKAEGVKDTLVDWKDTFAEKLKKQSNALLTVLQMEEQNADILPGIADYTEPMHRRRTVIDTILGDADRIISTWKKLDKKGKELLADTMHTSTLHDVDASRAWSGVQVANDTSSLVLGNHVAYTQAKLADRYKQKLLKQAAAIQGRPLMKGAKATEMRFQTQEQANQYVALLNQAERDQTAFRAGRYKDENLGRKIGHTQVEQAYGTMPDAGKEVYKATHDIHNDLANTKLQILTDRVSEAIYNGEKRQALNAMIRKQFESNKLDFYYAPLLRFGDQWFYGTTKDGKPYFETFNNTKARDRAAKKFNDENNTEVEIGTTLRDLAVKAAAVGDTFITDVIKIVDSKDIDEKQSKELQDEIYQMYLSTLPEVSLRHSSQHRKGTLGFEQDAMRAFAYTMHHGASQIANMKEGREMEQAVDEMREVHKLSQNAKGRQQAGLEIAAAKYLAENFDELSQEGAIDAMLADEDSDEDEHILKTAKMLLKKFGSQEKSDTLDALDDYVDKLKQRLARAALITDKNKNQAANVISEIEQTYNAMVNTQSSDMDAAAAYLRQFGFIYMLGFGVSSGIFNTMQTPMVAMPVVRAKYGMPDTVKQFKQAYAEFAAAVKMAFHKDSSGNYDMRDDGGNASVTVMLEKKIKGLRVGTPEWEKVNEELNFMADRKADGTISRTQTHDVISVGKEGVEHGGPLFEFTKKAGALFHHGERLNREVTLLAAFRIAREANKDTKPGADGFAEATEYARKVTNETHLEYAPENAARIFRGWPAEIAMQFKKYTQGMFYLWGKNVKNWRNGWKKLPSSTPEEIVAKEKAKQESHEATRTLAGLLAMQVSVAGVFGLPLADTLVTALEVALGLADPDDDSDKPYELEQMAREWLTENFGETFATAVTKGAVNAFTPVDTASRMDLSTVFFRGPLEELEGKDQMSNWLNALFGPTGGMMQRLWGGKNLISDGQYGRGLEQMLPKFASDPIQALRFATEDARSLDGILLKNMSLPEIALKAVGIGSSSLKDKYTERGYEMGDMKALQEARSKLLKKARTAKMEGTEMPVEEIQNWNRKHPGVLIQARHILASVRATLNQTKRNGSRGYYVDPKWEIEEEED